MGVISKDGIDKFFVELIELRGSPSERGTLFGSNSPDMVKEMLRRYWSKTDSFELEYFRKNFRFMKKEFPELIEEVEAFGNAAGLNSDEAYFTQIYSTGYSGCSALAIQTKYDGPVMLNTKDMTKFNKENIENWFKKRDRAVIQYDLKPYTYAATQTCISLSPGTAVNSAGLMVGGASGHPKFNYNDNPETVNLYWWPRIFAQYCSDCKEAMGYAKEYRCSGVKGKTITVADSKGKVLGIELESENIAFRESEDGIMLEVNHFQHQDLIRPSFATRTDFWDSAYYLNSMNRVMYVDYNKERFRSMERMEDFIAFSYEKGWPGRIIQIKDQNIASWVTFSASFVRAKDKSIRYYRYPLNKDIHQDIKL